MKWTQKWRVGAIGNRKLEERLYQEAFQELERGERHDGLWAKALAASKGDDSRAMSLYIDYRVRSLKDDLELVEALQSEATESSEPQSETDSRHRYQKSSDRRTEEYLKEFRALGYETYSASPSSAHWEIRNPKTGGVIFAPNKDKMEDILYTLRRNQQSNSSR